MNDSGIPTVGIIGGAGRMGRWFARELEQSGVEVISSDLESGLSSEALIQRAQIVIVSVPIGVAVEVIQQVVPFLHERQLLIDLTSLKAAPMSAMRAAPGEVLGLHPLFGPDVVSFKSQRVVVCEERSGPLAQKVLSWMQSAGALLVRKSPEEHDRLMAVVQGLNHFYTLAFAHTLSELGVSVADTLECASPIYQLRMELIGRILAQDSNLYAGLEIHNPHVPPVLEEFLRSAGALQNIIETHDVRRFQDFFAAAARHFGTYAQEAQERSSALIRTRTDPER